MPSSTSAIYQTLTTLLISRSSAELNSLSLRFGNIENIEVQDDKEDDNTHCARRGEATVRWRRVVSTCYR